MALPAPWGTNSPFLCLFVFLGSSVHSDDVPPPPTSVRAVFLRSPIQILVSSRNALTDTPRNNASSAVRASLSPAKWTHESNHHTAHPGTTPTCAGFLWLSQHSPANCVAETQVRRPGGGAGDAFRRPRGSILPGATLLASGGCWQPSLLLGLETRAFGVCLCGRVAFFPASLCLDFPLLRRTPS